MFVLCFPNELWMHCKYLFAQHQKMKIDYTLMAFDLYKQFIMQKQNAYHQVKETFQWKIHDKEEGIYRSGLCAL